MTTIEKSDSDRIEISPEALAKLGLENTVYVRPVQAGDLVGEVTGLDEVDAQTTLFAVHAADGTRMAVLGDRDAAFAAARHYEMVPVSVH